MRLPDIRPVAGAPLWPLLRKELREITAGRAMWTMLLLLCPLIGYSLDQAMTLYAEASSAARQSPVLATSLSPLDGIIVPTFGAFYVAITLLFPFVAIRTIGQEKETGALRLLVQLPYRMATLILVKLTAVFVALVLVALPALSAIAIWALSGGHVSVAETLNVVLGHALYALLVGAIALFCASICDGAATAAILALAFTISSWVLDFTLAGHTGLAGLIARLSLTQTVRGFEQGLFSAGVVAGILGAIGAFTALAAVWLPPGRSTLHKCVGSFGCILFAGAALGLSSQIPFVVDVTQDRRNSFAAADQAALAALTLPLVVTVHLVPEDPRYLDLQRNVLAKLERTVPHVTIRRGGVQQSLAASATDDRYGEIEYAYGGRSESSRSTSPREILPLIYGLAGRAAPPPSGGEEYPGYPLTADSTPALVWFFVVLPLLVWLAWWRTRHPRVHSQRVQQGDLS